MRGIAGFTFGSMTRVDGRPVAHAAALRARMRTAAFAPVIILGLFWKRTTKWGALAGMISGGAMVFIWKFGIAKLGGVFAIYELLPAFIVAIIFIVAVSLITKKPSKEIADAFDSVKAELRK